MSVRVVDPSKVVLRIGDIVVDGIESITYTTPAYFEAEGGLSVFDPAFSRVGAVVKELSVVLQHSSQANSAFFDWCSLNENNSLEAGKTVLFSEFSLITQVPDLNKRQVRNIQGYCIPSGKPAIGYAVNQADTFAWKFYCIERLVS